MGTNLQDGSAPFQPIRCIKAYLGDAGKKAAGKNRHLAVRPNDPSSCIVNARPCAQAIEKDVSAGLPA